jgi:hypothetical protein
MFAEKLPQENYERGEAKVLHHFASSCSKEYQYSEVKGNCENCKIYFPSFIAILPSDDGAYVFRFLGFCFRYFFLFILSSLTFGNRKTFWTACSCIKIEMREIIIRNGMVFFREGCWGEMF